MNSKHVFVYITVSSRDEAETISQAIIRERLVACTNIIAPMSALFWWDEAVQKEQEVVLVAKSTAAAFDRLADRVKALHSYECPCIIGLPIAMGSPDYLAWIDEEVRPDSNR
ncbi:MAG: divalent-cation tolerance protein CutA [Cyclonatronaceae bacterium]